MGGKKKGLSNRLAKMSDEEKARYLQHRAAIEEEAKQRKEQLIATYMKNKLKREEAFTRLNIAKINEHWHQILRKIKVKGLKTEIDDLRIWITKIVQIKNSIITRLMTEIEESEEQYQINLKSHLCHVDNFIDAETRLEQLEEERKSLDEQLRGAEFKIKLSEESKEILEVKLRNMIPSLREGDRVRRAHSFMPSTKERPVMLEVRSSTLRRPTKQ